VTIGRAIGLTYSETVEIV